MSQSCNDGYEMYKKVNTDKIFKFICSIRTWKSYVPFGICHCFKAEKQQEKFQRENALAANESTPRCGLINLINSHLAFSFFHFSTTTLLQLVYLCAVCRLFTQMNAYFLLMNSKRCITIYSLNVSILRFAYT